jgi:hypothetical protein
MMSSAGIGAGSTGASRTERLDILLLSCWSMVAPLIVVGLFR